MLLRNTHSENTSSNKTEALTKSIIIYIWVIGILNQLFMRNSYTQIKFSKKWSKKTPFFVVRLWWPIKAKLSFAKESYFQNEFLFQI